MPVERLKTRVNASSRADLWDLATAQAVEYFAGAMFTLLDVEVGTLMTLGGKVAAYLGDFTWEARNVG